MTQDGRKIREKIRALLARKDYRPLDKIDIAHKLGVTSGERVTLRKILRELERSGEIARIRGVSGFHNQTLVVLAFG